MKRFYFVLLVATLAPFGLAQKKNAADPALQPHHNSAVTPGLKAAPVYKDPGAAVHHTATGNGRLAPAKNGTDAQLSALEHQQATLHNPKPAPKPAAPAAGGKANNMGTNPPMNFTYKAPRANNAPVGGVANGRKQH
jgi:hypothetical protein